MTREEARNELVLWRNRNSDNGYHYKFVEALTMAIKVLEQEPAILIPTNATNKDMFKAVFGYEPATDVVVCNKEDLCGDSEPCNYCISNSNNIGREEDWWNALYKAESEG